MDEMLLGVFNDDIGMSEEETSDEERLGISLYLGDSIVDPNTVQSMGRVVALDPHAILSDFMKGEEDTSEKENSPIVSSDLTFFKKMSAE